jgi:hypothetical protein
MAAMSDTPGALQLRLLQTVTDVATEKNSTLVTPFPVELLRFFEHVGGGPSSKASRTHDTDQESHNATPATSASALGPHRRRPTAPQRRSTDHADDPDPSECSNHVQLYQAVALPTWTRQRRRAAADAIPRPRRTFTGNTLDTDSAKKDSHGFDRGTARQDDEFRNRFRPPPHRWVRRIDVCCLPPPVGRTRRTRASFLYRNSRRGLVPRLHLSLRRTTAAPRSLSGRTIPERLRTTSQCASSRPAGRADGHKADDRQFGTEKSCQHRQREHL